MDNLKDFKTLANEIMQDITVSSELKQKTLERCKAKKYRLSGFKAVPALCACVLLIFIGVYGSSLMKNTSKTEISANKSKNSNKTEIAIDDKKNPQVLFSLQNSGIGNTAAKAAPLPPKTEVTTSKVTAAPPRTAKRTEVNSKSVPKIAASAPTAHPAAQAGSPVAPAASPAIPRNSSTAKEIAMADQTPLKVPAASEAPAAEVNSAEDKKPAAFTIMSAVPDEKTATGKVAAAQSANSPAPTPAKALIVKLNSIDEAKKYLNGAVLSPSYIPEGFILQEIQAVNSTSGDVISILLSYFNTDKHIIISFEKDIQMSDFSGYNNVDINGSAGFMKSSLNGNIENSEIRWFAGNVLYTVQGNITEEEALNIARSLR